MAWHQTRPHERRKPDARKNEAALRLLAESVGAVTLDVLAADTGNKAAAIYDAVRAGKLKHVIIDGQVRVRPEDYAAYKKGHG